MCSRPFLYGFDAYTRAHTHTYTHIHIRGINCIQNALYYSKRVLFILRGCHIYSIDLSPSYNQSLTASTVEQ